MAKIAGFVITQAQWRAAGKPLRDPAWMRELLAICQKCDHYDPNNSKCKLCTCKVNTDPDDTMNKLRYPMTECPDNPPRWHASVEVDKTSPQFPWSVETEGEPPYYRILRNGRKQK